MRRICILVMTFLGFARLHSQQVILPTDFNFLPSDEQSIQFDNLEYLVESWKEDFQKSGLDLNTTDAEDLLSIGLTPLQAESVVKYRQRNGSFSCVEELQCIPEISIEWLRANKSKLFCSAASEKWTAAKVFKGGEYRILHRYKQRIPWNRFESNDTRLPGDLWIRFQYRNPGYFSWALSMVQAAGEPLFSEKQKQGFAYYSGYLQWDVKRKGFEKLIIGDYSMGLGQGLVLWRCWAPPAGGASLLRWRSSARGNAGSSRDRSLRGVYSLFQLHTSTSLEIFASCQPISATLDTTNATDQITSVYLGEKAITDQQLQRRYKSLLFLSGASIQFRLKGLHISAQSMYAGYKHPFVPIRAPHNADDWSGKPFVLSSVDAVLFVNSWQAYVEGAVASNKTFAVIAGIQHQSASKLETGFFVRYISPQYPLLFSGPAGGYQVPGQEYQLWGNYTPTLKHSFSYLLQYSARSGISYPRYWPYKRIHINAEYRFVKKRTFSFAFQYMYQYQFEQLYQADLKLYTPIPVSSHAISASLDAKPLAYITYRANIRWLFENQTQSVFCAQSLICKGISMPIEISAGLRFFHISSNARPVYDVQYEMPYSTGLYVLSGSGFQYDLCLGTKKLGPFRAWVRWSSQLNASVKESILKTNPTSSQISIQTEWSF